MKPGNTTGRSTGHDMPVLHPRPREPRQRPARREYVCTYCERGQCARCNDRACTCCYGNET